MASDRRPEVLRHTGFRQFWLASSVSELGRYVTTLALQVLVVTTLHGSASQVGLVNAARWLSYPVLGLVIGTAMEHRRRRPTLVVADVGRALLLGLIPMLWLADVLTIPAVIVLMLLFGVLSLANDGASQALLPRLVPRRDLLAANARLDQSSAVAQTSGPVIAGGLISALGAPVAVLVDAISYLYSGLTIARMRMTEPPAETGRHRPRRSEIVGGLRWIYRHRMLGAAAISTHGWFLCNAALTTIYVPFALRHLHLNAVELGVTLAAAGVGGVAGSLSSMRLGMRFGAGRTVIAARACMAPAWAVITLTPESPHWAALLLPAVSQLVIGTAMGAENANEMGYQQAITPDALQVRTHTTMRSMNRSMIVIGAPLGGALADRLGYHAVMWAAVVGFALVAVGLAFSPYRHARHQNAGDGRTP